MLRAIGIPLGIGLVLGVVGGVIAFATGNWMGVSNAMTIIGLASFVMLLFGGPSRATRRDGFGTREERSRNRAEGLRFGITCVLVGLPILVISIVMYFVHP